MKKILQFSADRWNGKRFVNSERKGFLQNMQFLPFCPQTGVRSVGALVCVALVGIDIKRVIVQAVFLFFRLETEKRWV